MPKVRALSIPWPTEYDGEDREKNDGTGWKIPDL